MTDAVRCLKDTGWVVVTRCPNEPNVYETCAYLKEATEFAKPDGRAENNGRRENFPVPDSGNVPDTVPGNVPDALKDLSVKSTSGNTAYKRTRQRARADLETSIFKEMADIFIARGGKWPAGTKEAVSLWALIDTCKSEADDWPSLLKAMAGMYWQLCDGQVSGKTWWKGHGFSPSKLRAAWADVYQMARTSQPIDAAAYARAALEAVP